ncbi:MAG: CapA family protein [Rickettsiales bacterium]|jgi:poly-gamma-glutamate synthesis protein (capsule biosynthesis protein)|nr:CapA family protein [Rickettsiales bacterium]
MKRLKMLFFKFKRMLRGCAAFAPPPDLSILLCGDFMLDSRIEPFLARRGLMYPFGNLARTIMGYDVRALNLETPLSRAEGEKWPGKKFNFKGAPYIARMLGRAGFCYASLANNHILDFGADVARDTAGELENWGIKYSGTTFAPNPRIIFANGCRIAFLSFLDGGIAPRGFSEYVLIYGAKSADEIARAKSAADLVIVSIHWGEELSRHANARQKKIAREMIDAGAGVVWGHHPHVIQETERYKDGVIFFSLGNFIFSHLTPKITRGLMAGLDVRGGKISAIRLHEIRNDNYLVDYAPVCRTRKPAGQMNF